MRRYLGLAGVVVAALHSGIALAQCMCTHHSSSPDIAYDAATVVFVGTVAEVVEIERVHTVTVEISEVWKGRPGRRLVIRENHCIVNYRMGERYLVYGWQGQDGLIWADACTRSQELAGAEADLDSFRSAGRSPKRVP